MTSNLLKILAPPADPVSGGAGASWESVEAALGTRLPADYREFAGIYGSGIIDDHLVVYDPFSNDPDVGLLSRVREDMHVDRELKADWPDMYWWPLFPEPGGWLPWGSTPHANTLYWVTKGDPNEWTVAVRNEDAATGEYAETLVSFLEGVLSGRIRCPQLGSYPWSDKHVFVPG